MPKKYRLSHADFVRLEKIRSQRVHGTYFSLSISPLPESTGPKMASVVSKKIATRAVDRNRIERQCRETLRSYMGSIAEPTALIIRAKREAADATSIELRDDIHSLMRRSGLARGS